MGERNTDRGGPKDPVAGGRFDRRQIQQAIADADLRVLLMCLYHLTGDHAWLEPPFRPVRDVRLIADPNAGLPSEVQEQIRRRAVELLSDGSLKPVITDPDDDLLQEMMNACLGEEVPPEYAPMMRQEMGFVGGLVDLKDSTLEHRRRLSQTDVLIVGAGLSGIALGAQLTHLDIPYTIVEQNPEVGGTWWDNHYPGAGVDTPNHAYSYSFGPRYPWTRYFSLRDEIMNYIVKSADDFGVRQNVRFSTELVAAQWNDDSQDWRVVLRSKDGTEETANVAVLVSSIGLLNVPAVPEISGVGEFEGPVFHSSRWENDLDLQGKRVSIIGTGATAMQIVPSIADQVESLTIYQRSPQWARPTDGYREEIPVGSQWLLTNIPYYVEWFRFSMLWRYGDGLLRTLRKDPEWPFPERAINRRNDLHREELTDFILSELGDRTDLIPKTVPNYPPFGKRILIENGWYQALLKPNVELVTDPIDHIEADSLVTKSGNRRKTDVIVFATGFKVTELTARLNIRGRGGRTLAEAWANDNPTAYLGMTIPGFPNLFCMQGPNSGLAHGGSAIFQAECQARYIVGCIAGMVAREATSIEVLDEVHDEYIRRVDAEHEQLIWTHRGMSNWYRNPHGRVVAIMPWRLVDYWHMTHAPDFSDYQLTSEKTPVIATSAFGKIDEATEVSSVGSRAGQQFRA